MKQCYVVYVSLYSYEELILSDMLLQLLHVLWYVVSFQFSNLKFPQNYHNAIKKIECQSNNYMAYVCEK